MIALLTGALEDEIRRMIGLAVGEYALVGLQSGAGDRLEVLGDLYGVLHRGQAAVADARAQIIAKVAGDTSTRQAAETLGLSVAAVAKAVARARALPRPGMPAG